MHRRAQRQVEPNGGWASLPAPPGPAVPGDHEGDHEPMAGHPSAEQAEQEGRVEQRSLVELRRLQLARAVRAAIRMKHSLAADEEINAVLPEILRRYDRAVAEGKEFRFNPARLYQEAW